MPRFPVSAAKEAALMQRMAELGVLEDDLEESFIRGGGPGGQKINKTSSCVYLCHGPSNIEIKCQRGRSQAMNRYYARQELCDRLEEVLLGEQSRKQKAAEKIRRQKRKRSKRAKEKMLEGKKHTAKKKTARKKPTGED